MSEVLTHLDRGVATVTLNRAERRNALTIATATLLDQTLRSLDADQDVRCIVLTGAGTAFCSGDDMAQWDAEEMSTALERFAAGEPEIAVPLAAFVDAATPIVAAVNGAALGAGMDLALLCDLRVASTDAYFAQSYVKHGLTPYIGGLWWLPRLVGPALAAELLYTGRKLDAAEALACGLVSRVVEPQQLSADAAALAAAIADRPRSATRAIKEGLRRAADATYGDLGELAGWASRTLADRFTELRTQAEERS